MAKTQTFADKLKKKKPHELKINVKVIKGMTGEAGTTRFVEKFIKVDDLNELNTIDI